MENLFNQRVAGSFGELLRDSVLGGRVVEKHVDVAVPVAQFQLVVHDDDTVSLRVVFHRDKHVPCGALAISVPVSLPARDARNVSNALKQHPDHNFVYLAQLLRVDELVIEVETHGVCSFVIPLGDETDATG